MRDIKVLLGLLLHQVEECKQDVFAGMCGEIEVLGGHHLQDPKNIRTDEMEAGEVVLLLDYLTENRPKHKTIGEFWWKGKNKYNKAPRIEWLKQHIEKL